MVKKVVKKVVTTETVDDEGTKKTVVKEHAPKEIIKRKKKVSREKKMTAREREELLIENFVGLQHAMTNMSIKFGALSDNISRLLQVFEESAKNFVSGGKPDDNEMLEKINSLLNQNKTIAKGLVLMEGKLRGRSDTSLDVPSKIRPSPQPPLQPSPQPSIQQPISNNPGPKPLPTL